MVYHDFEKQNDFNSLFINNRGTNDIVIWISSTKYRLLKPEFIERIKMNYKSILFTKCLSLKSSLFGPYLRIDRFNLKMKCKIFNQ